MLHGIGPVGVFCFVLPCWPVSHDDCVLRVVASIDVLTFRFREGLLTVLDGIVCAVLGVSFVAMTC